MSDSESSNGGYSRGDEWDTTDRPESQRENQHSERQQDLRIDASARRGLVLGFRGRVLLRRRAVGLWEDHAVAVDRGPRRSGQWFDSGRWFPSLRAESRPG